MRFRYLLVISGMISACQLLASKALFAAEVDEGYAHVEFDNNMLWGTPEAKQSADLSRFSEGNPVPAGDLKVDIFLNGDSFRSKKIYFSPVSGKNSARACFSPADFEQFGIITQKLPVDVLAWLEDKRARADCRFIDKVVPGAEARFDFSEQRLDVSIPQAFLHERAQDYIDPAQWDRGITAGRLNYSADIFNSISSGDNTTQGYGYFEAGFNIAGWRLRNISSLGVDEHSHSYQSQRTYAQTDVEKLRSTLTLGRNYTEGQLFNSYGLQGAFLSTDIRMLPPSLRSYAPVVAGTAATNARVVIRQNNIVVYERSVPPGPFEINNLQTAGYGNDLEVTVTEADGSSKKFNVPYSPLVQLLRPKQLKYSASLGQAWNPTSNSYNPEVAQGTLQYGVNNAFTALAGGILSEDYTALALGGAISTTYGGFSADYTLANSQFEKGRSSQGDSVRLIYSTLIAPTNTNITLSSYRYSSRGFWSFNEFLANQNDRQNFNSGPGSDDFFGAKQKGRFDISLRQHLTQGLGNINLSGYTRNFWNRDGTDTQYQVSYGNRYKELSYDFSAARVRNQNNNEYNEFRLSLSIPIFARDGTSSTYLSATAWNNSETGSVSQAQLGGIAGDDQQYTYGVTTTQGLDNRNPQQSYGVNGSYSGAKALVTAGMSKGNGYQQTSVGLSGSVLAHSDGIVLGQTLGETAALIEAKDAGGARITSSSGAALDNSGFGVVPYLSPYSRNQIEVDPAGLSSDLQMEDTSAEVIPVAGSVVKVKFATSKQPSALIQGTLEGGEPLPFGAEVVDGDTNKLVGYVGQAGTIFARGLKERGRIIVKLKDGSCAGDYLLPKAKSDRSDSSLLGMKVVCKLLSE